MSFVIRQFFTLRVPHKPGRFNSSPRWSNQDLDPLPLALRTWGGIDFWAYWCSDMLAPPLAATVSTVMSLGFTARETIPIVFFGFMICSVIVTLTGKMGATYHVPYPVIVRSSFGMFGSYPAIVIRAFVAMMWTAILCVQAGGFLQCCLEAIWPDLEKRIPNRLPESMNITSAGLLCFFLYWIAQTILMLMPIQKLRILFLVKGVIVPPTFLALFLWAVIVTRGGGELVTGKANVNPNLGTAYAALTGLNVMIGLFSSMAVNMPDFGRFSKNRLAGYHQFFALPIIGTLGALTPIFVTSAHSHIWGEFEWYMPAVISKFDNRAAKFFTAASFILATIGNQIAAGSFPFSNDISGLAPGYINIVRGTILMCIFCVVSQPWLIIKNAAGLLSFLSGYSCLMGPLAGILVSDYYLIRQRKLDVRELYKEHGIYWYFHGVNWRAFVAFLIGFIPLLPGFARSIAGFDATGRARLHVADAWKIYTFAWLFGFTIASLCYYVICVYISPPKESLVDVAVLPPLTKAEEEAGECHWGLEWPVDDTERSGVPVLEEVVTDKGEQSSGSLPEKM